MNSKRYQKSHYISSWVGDWKVSYVPKHVLLHVQQLKVHSSPTIDRCHELHLRFPLLHCSPVERICAVLHTARLQSGSRDRTDGHDFRWSSGKDIFGLYCLTWEVQSGGISWVWLEYGRSQRINKVSSSNWYVLAAATFGLLFPKGLGFFLEAKLITIEAQSIRTTKHICGIASLTCRVVQAKLSKVIHACEMKSPAISTNLEFWFGHSFGMPSIAGNTLCSWRSLFFLEGVQDGQRSRSFFGG